MLNDGQVSEQIDPLECIKLTIRKDENLMHEFCLLHPFLHVYFCNSKGENILKKSVIIHRTSNQRYGSNSFPIRIDFDETIWIEGPLLHSIVEDDVVILIEVVEATVDMKRSLYNVQAKVMCYAFLKLYDTNEASDDIEECRNTRLQSIGCKLQIFEWQRRPWFRKSHSVGLDIDVRKAPQVFTQFLLKRKSLLTSHLYIEIEASENVVHHYSTAEMDEGFQFNHESITDKTIQPDTQSIETEKKEDESNLASYKRSFNGKCQLPDELFMKIDVCNVVTSSLSNSGDLLVIATHDKYLNMYNISEPKETSLVSSKFIFMAIRSICWSSDDSTLACGGNDNRVLLIRIDRKSITTLKIQYTAFYLDPSLHPSALTFHPIPEEPLLLIGLSNGSFYFKNTSKIESKNCFQKFHEQIHESSIDAIVCNMYNGRIISGDSKGKVVIWKPRQLSNIQSVAEFTVLFQFTVNKPILHLSLRTCNSDEEPHSLLITARNQTAGTLIMYDLISHEMRPFCLSNKGNEHDFSLANYSPDFKYVIAATQEGKVVLLDNSGMMRKHDFITTPEIGVPISSIVWSKTHNLIIFAYSRIISTVIVAKAS